VELPAIPAAPRHVAGEDREEFDGSGIGFAAGEPTAVGAGRDAEDLGGRVVAQLGAPLQVAQNGQIGREALGE